MSSPGLLLTTLWTRIARSLLKYNKSMYLRWISGICSPRNSLYPVTKVIFLHCKQNSLQLIIMEQKLLGWMIFLWSRKYMFSWQHWHGTFCHLDVLRKHLACFLTCCSRPFSVASSKCTINTKMSSNAKLSSLHNAICSGLLQCNRSSLFHRWRSWAKDAHEPWARSRAKAQLLHTLGAHSEATSTPIGVVVSAITANYSLYKNIPSETLRHLKRPYDNTTFT